MTVQVVDLGGGQLISVPAAALSQIATPAVGNLEVNATQVGILFRPLKGRFEVCTAAGSLALPSAE